MCTVALTKLLSMAPRLPPSVMGGLPRIFATMVKLVVWKFENSEDDSDDEVDRAGGAPESWDDEEDARATHGDAPDPLDAEHDRLLREARAMLGHASDERVPLASLEAVRHDEDEEEGTGEGTVEVDAGFGIGDEEAKQFESDIDPLVLAEEFDMDYTDYESTPACDLFDVSPAQRTDTLVALQACMGSLSKLGGDRMRSLMGGLPAEHRGHMEEYGKLAGERVKACKSTALG